MVSGVLKFPNLCFGVIVFHVGNFRKLPPKFEHLVDIQLIGKKTGSIIHVQEMATREPWPSQALHYVRRACLSFIGCPKNRPLFLVQRHLFVELSAQPEPASFLRLDSKSATASPNIDSVGVIPNFVGTRRGPARRYRLPAVHSLSSVDALPSAFQWEVDLGCGTG